MLWVQVKRPGKARFMVLAFVSKIYISIYYKHLKKYNASRVPGVKYLVLVPWLSVKA